MWPPLGGHAFSRLCLQFPCVGLKPLKQKFTFCFGLSWHERNGKLLARQALIAISSSGSLHEMCLPRFVTCSFFTGVLRSRWRFFVLSSGAARVPPAKLIFVLLNQFFEYLRATLCKHAIRRDLESARSSYGKRLTLIDLFEGLRLVGTHFRC